MIRRAAIRDKVYEEQRGALIPIAEAWADQVVPSTAIVHRSNDEYCERWNKIYCERMKLLAVALGIAVHVEVGS